MSNSIPASDIVQVIPSVLSAGGNALDLIGLCLTQNQLPVGTIAAFPSPVSVANYFGQNSDEAATAAVYFLGYNNSTAKPGSLLMARYSTVPLSAFLRSGVVSGITLAALQALSGTVIATVDGQVITSATINLASATSFSAAAALIQTGLQTTPVTEAVVTGTIGATCSSGTIASTVLTVAGTVVGKFAVGQVVSGAGVTVGTTILSLGTGTGGAGTYNLSVASTVSSGELVTGTDGTMNVTAVSSGTLAIGQTVTGPGSTVAAHTVITALGTGTGGTGTYTVSVAQQVNSETLTVTNAPTCTYDSVAGAFTITSSSTGVASTIGFATGTLSTALMLTSATGAVTSQGAAAGNDPVGFMNSIIDQTTNWCTFWTLFDPDNGSGNTQKLAFARWVNSTSPANRYVYVEWDNDITAYTQDNAASSVGNILTAANSSGTAPIVAPSGFRPEITDAPFIAGAIASINFNQHNGRITLCYKAQTGLVSHINSLIAKTRLVGNGYNAYANWATGNEQFIGLVPGQITGPYKWIDSYVNQIWLNNQFQLALVELLFGVGAVPFSVDGDNMIAGAMQDPINQGLDFGAFAPGNISVLQATEINNQAGSNISDTLQNNGWYLQILPDTSQDRAARIRQKVTFWYLDRGAVQKIVLNSIEVQ